MPVSPTAASASGVHPGAGSAVLLRAERVTKTFGGVKAVSKVSFDIRAGEILAVVGENGAGKSTIMKVLSGNYPSGSFDGSLELRGETAAFSDVHAAERAGIVLIPQELRIAGALPIAENMFVGHLPSRFGIVDSNTLHRQARKSLELFDMDIDPARPAELLSTSEQRMTLIAGALALNADVLLLDEPTAALTDQETQQLFSHLLALRAQGLGIVLITHRLDEVEQIADRAVVMRNGRLVAEFDSIAGRRSELVEAMIGRAVEKTQIRSESDFGDVVMSIRDLRVEDPVVKGKLRVDGVDLTLRAGEVHGLYGLVGAGRTELARALFGTWPGRVSGDIDILGESTFPRSGREAIRRGIAMLTEDRKSTGIITGHSVLTNISAANMRAISRFGVLNLEAERRRNAAFAEDLDIRPRNLDMAIDSLSGGNQQKALLGRWLAINPRILILDEPTLGVDIGARFEVYRVIRQLAETGLAVLLISSDVDEVKDECDRVTVMYKGQISRIFTGERSKYELVAAATGGEQK